VPFYGVELSEVALVTSFEIYKDNMFRSVGMDLSLSVPTAYENRPASISEVRYISY
jgi:hypothetical protein